MAATPKPVRKAIKAHKPKDKAFMEKHAPQANKQAEKKMLNKQAKTHAKLNSFETPKHEKSRKMKTYGRPTASK